MEDINRTRYLIKAKAILFCNRIDSELTKPNRKFLQEMIYGMVSRKSVLLTEIARKLRTSTSFKKVHERLRLNLKKDGWGNILEDNLIVENDRRVYKETVVALDISDLSKKNATKMEHICKVRDGSQSSSSKTKTGLGYWLFEAVGINRSKAEKFPLLGWLYSSESSDFISENNVVLKGFRKLKEAFGNRGIYAFDRGGDRGKLIKPLLEEGFRLVIRMIGTRKVTVLTKKKVRKQILSQAADNCRCKNETNVWSEKKKRKCHLSYGRIRIKLPFYEKELNLVVVKGFSKKPMMLLTTENIRYKHQLWRVVEIYLSRWGVEELIRFKKQAFDLENIRVLKYKSLQNMMVLVNVAVMFLISIEGGSLIFSCRIKSFVKHLPNAEKVKLTLYHLIDGIKEVIGYTYKPTRSLRKRSAPTGYMQLPLNMLFQNSFVEAI